MFLPWTPIMSALSATTPIMKGQLTNHDFRWEVIEKAVDCRTPDEIDPNSEKHICKSRYSTVSRYISNHAYVRDFHNDCHFKPVCPDVIKSLSEGGVDQRLADHVASLFIRSPIPVYEKEIAFPCCEKEQAEEIISKVVSDATPTKIRQQLSEVLNKSPATQPYIQPSAFTDGAANASPA